MNETLFNYKYLRALSIQTILKEKTISSVYLHSLTHPCIIVFPSFKLDFLVFKKEFLTHPT